MTINQFNLIIILSCIYNRVMMDINLNITTILRPSYKKIYITN